MTVYSASRLAVVVDDPPSPALECPIVAAVRSRGYTVVALTGEYDISNAHVLTALLADTASKDDSNVVLDLRRVQYMGASAIHVIVRTRECLARRSRSLTLRSPSPIARRVLDICRVADRMQPSKVRLREPI